MFSVLDENSQMLAVYVTAPLVLLILVLTLSLCCLHKHKQQKRVCRKQEENEIYEFYNSLNLPIASFDPATVVTSAVVADKWELPHSCLHFGSVLGHGAFGQVVLGLVLPSHLKVTEADQCQIQRIGRYAVVAVKMLQDETQGRNGREFLNEIDLMKKIGYHKNVLSILGCCTIHDPVCLVVEHAPLGDLLSYLQKKRRSLQSKRIESDEAVCARDELHANLLSFLRQVAVGMEFLSQKGYIHRDLAARNVLVCSPKLVKIGDFGLTRYVYDDKIYVNQRGGKLPLKWMSIEAIAKLTFSTASDVWSFGILLFEVVTLGSIPYPAIDNSELLQELSLGHRIAKPQNCSQALYDIMLLCWEQEPANRPNFSQLRHVLEQLLEQCSNHDYIKLDFDPESIADYHQTMTSDGSDSGILDGRHPSEPTSDDTGIEAGSSLSLSTYSPSPTNEHTFDLESLNSGRCACNSVNVVPSAVDSKNTKDISVNISRMDDVFLDNVSENISHETGTARTQREAFTQASATISHNETGIPRTAAIILSPSHGNPSSPDSCQVRQRKRYSDPIESYPPEGDDKAGTTHL
ncbi:hypothetical protein ScPMuIL_013791 [Solemya velum]